MSEQEQLDFVMQEFYDALNEIEIAGDLFKAFSILIEENSGGLAFGYWLASGADQKLNLKGWGGLKVPKDSPSFVKTLVVPFFKEMFDDPSKLVISVRDMGSYKYPRGMGWIVPQTVGITSLSIPLMASGVGRARGLLGMLILYRRGEQPFLESDLILARGVVDGMSLVLERILSKSG